MVFSSPFFLSFFFPLLLVCYFLSPKRLRNYILFLASIFFYAWGEPCALPVMLGVIFANFYFGRMISARPQKSALYLFIGLLLNLSILFFYKYLDFALININQLLSWFALKPILIPEIILPAGISFYIFQAISYIVDVKRANVKPQKALLKFALYISLFPQLIAGPIVRYATIASELDKRQLILSNIYTGLARFATGLAKKVFLADGLGQIADCVLDAPVGDVPQIWAWVGIICYTLQIYYDFSGYSDMAIGIGRIFNFHFPENFNYPYSAKSLRDFWQRWHMSLTAWLRDYIYIPLGGNRTGHARHYLNIMIVLVACGLWHGAAWNFIFWGFYNGCGLIIQDISGRFACVRNHMISGLSGWFLTMLFVLTGWVFFRVPELDAALEYIRILYLGNVHASFFHLPQIWENHVTISNCIFILVALVLSQPIAALRTENLCKTLYGGIFILLLFCATFAFAMTSSYSPFLYFRF